MKDYSLKACHEKLGTVPKNPRWSWSGISPNGDTVAVNLWQDHFSDAGRVYETGSVQSNLPWVGTPGHNELMENLKWARDNLNGEVSVVVLIAKDKSAHPRTIQNCFPHSKLKMRVAHLDVVSGEFRLERIEEYN